MLRDVGEDVQSSCLEAQKWSSETAEGSQGLSCAFGDQESSLVYLHNCSNPSAISALAFKFLSSIFFCHVFKRPHLCT